jgi:hypothetical protein
MKKQKTDSIHGSDPMGDAFIKFMESQGHEFVDMEVKDEKGKKIKIRTLKGFIPKKRNRFT